MTDEKEPRPVPAATNLQQTIGEHQKKHRRTAAPPPSMWTAPQSLIPPPNPSNLASPERQATYFRRVTQQNNQTGPKPTSFQRGANLVGGILGVSVAVYCVLFHDFGDREHVFMPVSSTYISCVYQHCHASQSIVLIIFFFHCVIIGSKAPEY